MKLFSSLPKDILTEEIKDALDLVRTRFITFSAVGIISLLIKLLSPVPIPNLVFLIFGFFWLETILSWYFFKKWGTLPKANILLEINKNLLLLEIVVHLFLVYYLSPLLVFLFGSVVWLAVFLYLIYNLSPIGYGYTERYLNSCFILSFLCVAIVIFWEYTGLVPFPKEVSSSPGFFFHNLEPSLFLFFLLLGVFIGIRGYNVGRWKKFKAINQELKQKSEELESLNKELELKVKERTQELEDAKMSLEIRVAARTRELKELAESLDRQVKERTKELEEKIKDLEKFQRLTIGRELRMIELKKEIKELKEKIKKYGVPA